MSIAADAPAQPATTTTQLATPAYKWTLGLAAAVLQSAVYFGIGHLHLNRSTELLRTRLDDAIPFWPWTSWCYLPFYAGVFLIAIVGIRRRALFNRAVDGGGDRHDAGRAGTHLRRRRIPAPGAAPALPRHLERVHGARCSRSTRPATCSRRCTSRTPRCWRSSCSWTDRPRLGAVALVMATLLALSTLTTKQHFIADVVVGLPAGVRSAACSRCAAASAAGSSLAAGAGADAAPWPWPRRAPRS